MTAEVVISELTLGIAGKIHDICAETGDIIMNNSIEISIEDYCRNSYIDKKNIGKVRGWVYCFGKGNETLYVGETGGLIRKRLHKHFRNYRKGNGKGGFWEESSYMKIFPVEENFDRKFFELALITYLEPSWNQLQARSHNDCHFFYDSFLTLATKLKKHLPSKL